LARTNPLRDGWLSRLPDASTLEARQVNQNIVSSLLLGWNHKTGDTVEYTVVHMFLLLPLQDIENNLGKNHYKVRR
jgi:hypothetical protein